jgi:predicted ATPase
MNDQRNKLQELFEPGNRFNNFGNAIVRMNVQGFRCHANIGIDIQSPITAFCGLNGTGKSTLLQLAAAAYATSKNESDSYNIASFIVSSPLDPRPFTSVARVEYGFWTSSRDPSTLTLSRNDASQRWQGYRRRPQRPVFFTSIGSYLPKIEQRDFMIRDAQRLTISAGVDVSERIRTWTCQILGQHYEKVMTKNVIFAPHKGVIMSVQRDGVSYSEVHMGFGEARAQYLVSHLENWPDKSLVLIEEPEISLHPSAQYEFGRYLIDVAIRKRHQILLTTHSEFILEALPSLSRIYLDRTPSGVVPKPGLTSAQVKSLMAGGAIKALTVLVEDICAEAMLTEMIRRVDPDFLMAVDIHPGGDENAIAMVLRMLLKSGIPIAAVRDADMPEIPKENLFKLPGSKPPEKELFGSIAVRAYVEKTYKVRLDDFLAGISGVDHHEWISKLALRVSQTESALLTEIARAYAAELSESAILKLVGLLKEAPRK